MTVAPLIVSSRGSGPPQIIDLSVTCPTVSVTTGPPPPTGAGGAALLLLLVVGAVVMSKK